MSALVQRRTIAKGAAWSVPVVALAGAAPAASASTACSLGLGVNIVFEQDRVTYSYVRAELTILAGGCAAGERLDVPLQVQFTLNSPYLDWDCDVFKPSHGFTGGSFTVQTTQTFAGAGDSGRFSLSAGKRGAATPITFTISAAGLTTTTFTANPT